MSEFIEGSAPVQNAVLMAKNLHETEIDIQNIQNASNEIEPQQNSTPISSSSGSTATANVKDEVRCDLDEHLSNDSYVICLGDEPMVIVDLTSEDPVTVQTPPSQVVSAKNT